MATKSKHTSGPWHVGMRPGPIIYNETGDQVANMCDGLYGDDEHRANARLMASAPDLVAELKGLIDQIEGLGIEDWHGAEGLDLSTARAAIARAEGDQ